LKKSTLSLLLLYATPLPILIFSLCIGPSDVVSVKEALMFIGKYVTNSIPESPENDMIRTIILEVRLPRVLLAFLVGAALSVSGGGLQAIFRNPLVSPYILGLSSGAAFGAAMALAWGVLNIQLSAFIFGMIAVALSYMAAMRHKQVSVVSLILSGIIVGGIFTALLTIVQFLSDPFKLQSIVHWTMGNLHNAGWEALKSVYLPILLGILILFMMRWKLNVLSLGNDEARSSGINPETGKIIVLTAATIASSAAVSVAGIIGLYGLIIPHMVRMMVGPDNNTAIPANIVFGGTFLLIIDNFSRTIAAFEIPIGIFTMLLGAPFFLYLMKKSKIGWA